MDFAKVSVRNVCRGVIPAAWLLFAADPTIGAEIQKQPVSGDSRDLITISGVFELGDDEAFREIAATSAQGVVLLNSEGGSVVAALEIGRAIRLKGFATAVSPNTLCASACALTWLAGSPRFRGEASHIGFHASYVLTEGKPSESGVANALIGAYLNQLGLSQDAIIFITSAPPEGIEWLTSGSAAEIGIAFADLDAGSGLPETDTPKKAFDPIGTVTAFYNALSAADGETAAAFVIPEKRGIGPFNEQSIHDFFGGLSAPLKLTAVALTTENSVSAAYRYTRGTERSAMEEPMSIRSTVSAKP